MAITSIKKLIVHFTIIGSIPRIIKQAVMNNDPDTAMVEMYPPMKEHIAIFIARFELNRGSFEKEEELEFLSLSFKKAK